MDNDGNDVKHMKDVDSEDMMKMKTAHLGSTAGREARGPGDSNRCWDLKAAINHYSGGAAGGQRSVVAANARQPRRGAPPR